MPNTGRRHQPDQLLLQMRERLEAESSDGLRLLADPRDNPICSIALDESIPAIVVIWKQYATSTQLRFIHEHLLRMLEEHGVGKILGDDTRLPMIHAEDQAWITQDWMPRAVAAGLRAGASVTPSSYFGRSSVGAIQASADTRLNIRMFGDMPQARRWLQGLALESA